MRGRGGGTDGLEETNELIALEIFVRRTLDFKDAFHLGGVG